MWDKKRERLGRRIQDIRKANGETQEELAAALGIDRQVVKTWENATRHIKAPDLIALADHYDCTLDFLVGRSDNPSTDMTMQEMCDYTGLSQWSIEELHNCTIETERKEYIETINAILENEDIFHEMALNIVRAAEAKTMWRMVQDLKINVHNPDYWNEANRVLTIANVSSEEYSPFNYATVPDDKNTPVLLPAGSWFLTSADAAEFMINRASELFRDIISDHIDKWNLWPDLDFTPGANGETSVTINSDSQEEDADNGKN